jgi:hypothetical protein
LQCQGEVTEWLLNIDFIIYILATTYCIFNTASVLS